KRKSSMAVKAHADRSEVIVPLNGAGLTERGGCQIVGRSRMLLPVGPKRDVTLVAACVCGGLAASANAYVYWSNFAGSSVGRAGLDGGGANENFVAAPQASGIAVDAHFVYWADEAAKTIGRANLDGSAPNQNFITGLSDPTGVAVDAGHVYWTDEGTNTIG